MMFTDKSFGKDFAKDPCVVFYNEKYYMYYSIWNNDTRILGIGIASSCDMESWKVIGNIPITQECEKKGIGAPGAVVYNGAIHMFYQTYGSMENDKICHAVSYDGINFVKDESNPVFAPSKTWCCGRAIDADVVIFGGRLYLYYATRDHSIRIQKIGVASSPLDGNFSRNTWREELFQSVLAPEFKFEGECIEAPATFVHDDTVFMFYGGSYNCTPQQIGLATSKDAVHFDKVYSEPFLPCGKDGEWNASESGHPYAFIDHDGKIYLFYQGSPDNGKSWYISKLQLEIKDGLPVIVK